MKTPIVETDRPVALIGGGGVQAKNLHKALKYSDKIVCADGGVTAALDGGIHPDFVIGDMDSLPNTAMDTIRRDRFHRIAEQDSTDFDKCIRSISAPLILGVGFLGHRLDHTLAALHVLARYPGRRCILVGQHDVAFLVPPQLSLPLDPGCRVSLIPLAKMRGQSKGLKWEIDDVRFDPLKQIGNSNQAKGQIEVTMEKPAMIMLLPTDTFDLAVTAIGSAGAGWSAPDR